MGLLVSIPVIIIFNSIRKRYFSNTQDYEDSGAMLQVKQYIFSLLLRISKLWQTKRVQNTAPEPSSEIDKIGLVPLQLDRELDYPATEIPQRPNIADGVCISGFSSKGDCLIVRLTRRCEDKVEIILYLRLSDGSEYQLPTLPDTRAYASDAQNFSCRGLKIQCLSAMSRWRIAYNGLLRRLRDKNEDNGEIIHVKFSFIWTAVTLVYDFQRDFNCELLAEALSKDNSLLPYSKLSKLNERLDCYEQWGQFSGTISIGTQEEKEMYLWGPRTRNRGIIDWKEIENYQSIYGQMKDGTKFHVGTLSIHGIVSELKYGYIILPNHFIHSIESCYFEMVSEDENIPEKIVFTAGGKTYTVYYYRSNDGFNSYCGDQWNVSSRLQYTKFRLDNFEGRGFVETGVRNETEKPPSLKQMRPCLLREPGFDGEQVPWVVDFKDKACESSKISGGKGSSLAMLRKLSTIRQNNSHVAYDNFMVPKGIVVTTAAYRYHLSVNENVANEISSLSSNQNLKELEEVSKRLMNSFTETTLSDKLKAAILQKIQSIFPQEFSNKSFAVRSSASGEDSDETSAAGQMATFLGIRTIDQIYENIVKCWSSQFSLTAINYKRQTGQVIDSNMAVVIQEMVSAEVAGVAFTCDPLTGNPENITITANYGLGESVVSASADPDTIILKRSVDNKLVLHSESIGRKDLRIQISNVGGVTTESTLDADSKKCSLKREDSLKIGRVAILVEESFGNARDIEWAIADGKLYLLQARPITTSHRETDFEIIHELDTGMLTEFEYLTKANVGEVMPGALCPLTATTLNKLMDIAFQHNYYLRYGKHRFVYHPGFPTVIAIYASQVFLNILETILRQVNKEENIMTHGWQWSLFGRDIEISEELREIAIHRYGEFPPLNALSDLACFFIRSFKIPKQLEISRKMILNAYLPENMKVISSHQLYTIISQMLPKHCKVSDIHCECSGFSSLYNIFILSILASTTGDMNEGLFSKFSSLLSNCKNVESADVPEALKNLADSIVLYGAREKILNMTSEEATKWLQEEKGKLGAKYRSFIQQHGHRSLMEFDLYTTTWNMDAVPLVKTLQSMLKKPNEKIKNISKENSPDSSINELSLNISVRLLLKTLVKWAKHAVGQRERSKSVLIRSADVFRKAYRKLGQTMFEEGRIPEQDLIFFFTHEEIGELLKTRSARLVSKAVRRKRMHPQLNVLRYPEITSGPPRPVKTQTAVIENGVSDWVIKATPVSQGKVIATARVVASLDEAHIIQPGDILVAYSTDIGWTPYFPMLAGVVTELGGLISHGAVVAREFGLPCIVGAINATNIVNSGDLVMLDGNNGILKKISKAEENSLS